ncbi:MAG: hypothetical protein ACRDN0_16000 [Trebonia sp.]
MSTATTTPSPGLPRKQVIRAVTFAVVAVLCIAFGLTIYFPPGHLYPQALAGGTQGHHPLRVTAAVLVGLAFAAAAVSALKGKDPATVGHSPGHSASHSASPNA